MDPHDRARSAPHTVDHRQPHYNHDTTHTNSPSNYNPCYGTNIYHGADRPMVAVYGIHNVWPVAANPQPQPVLYTVPQTGFPHVDGAASTYRSPEWQTPEVASQRVQYSQQEQDGSGWEYRNQSHTYYPLKDCSYCHGEQSGANPFCQACDRALSQYAPMLAEVPLHSDVFRALADKFAKDWSHPTKCPTVYAVYRVIGTQRSWDAYYSYRNRLENYGKFTAQGKEIGNEYLLWHGTRRMCNLGYFGNTMPCTSPACALCSILRGSFDVAKAGTNMRWMRFGAGIYTSSASSKAGSYSTNLHSSDYKVILLNNVAVGNTYEAYYNKPTLVCPPWGYDSVHRKASADLNYDEVAVYTNHAIRPSWLILYA